MKVASTSAYKFGFLQPDPHLGKVALGPKGKNPSKDNTQGDYCYPRNSDTSLTEITPKMSGWAPSTETGPNFRGTQRTTSKRGTAATRGTVATRGTGAARGTAVTRGTAAARGTHGRILARTGLLGVLAPPAARIPHVQESQKERQGRPILKVAPHPVQRRHGQLHAEDEESVQSLGNNLAPPPSDTQGIWARRFESILPPKGPSSPATQGK